MASFFTEPRLVGVVGEDFPDEHRRLFASRNIDTAGPSRPRAKRFAGRPRHLDMNTRDTLEVHLNVRQLRASAGELSRQHLRFPRQWQPVVAGPCPQSGQATKLVLADTMDLWIDTQRADLLNQASHRRPAAQRQRAKLLTGEDNLVRAGHWACGRPKFVLLKKGEHGAMLFHDEPHLRGAWRIRR